MDTDIVAYYHSMIETISLATGMPDRMLHLYAGLGLFMLGHLVTRRSSAALLLVLVAEGGNEVMDRLYFGSWRWDDTVPDIVQTVFWPLMLALFLRVVRFRATRRA